LLLALAACGEQPGEAIPVGQLARRMGVAQPTVSNHLNILRRMGLVRLEQVNGRLTLTVSRPSGATVTLAASLPPAAPPEVSATDDKRSG